MPVATRMKNVPRVSAPRYHVALNSSASRADLHREQVQEYVLLHGL